MPRTTARARAVVVSSGRLNHLGWGERFSLTLSFSRCRSSIVNSAHLVVKMALRSVALFTFLAAAAAFPPQLPLSDKDNAEQGGANVDSAKALAPSVFNAVHSVMRQWGSSVNHNGMSFFPAVVPAHTDLYHGRHGREPLTKGLEWLAFEIEHAEVFARNGRPGGGGGPGGPHGPGGGRGPPGDEMRPRADGDVAALHHYRTSRDLNVLLLDGMSAGKTSMGTLDQQDYVLCNGTEGFGTSQAAHPDAGPPGDSQRAGQMCEEYGEHIDGVVRMEAGFELILCDFGIGIDFVSATPRPQADSPESVDALQQFEYLRGIGYRYHGITAGRVRVDYSNMVSAFFYDVNLTNPDPEHAALPRLVSADETKLQAIKTEVTSVLAKVKTPSIDWQGIVDLIVTRYSDRLQFMADAATSHESLVSEVNFLLNLYIDYSASSPDIQSATTKCTSRYLDAYHLTTPSDNLIHASLSTVTNQICSTLFSVRHIVLTSNSTSSVEKAKGEIAELISYLKWTTWLECGKCAYDEVCFVAIWPFGGVGEHERPGCVKSDDVASKHGYWGFPGRGRPGGGGGGGRHGPPLVLEGVQIDM